jgi:hypothetical protein
LAQRENIRPTCHSTLQFHDFESQLRDFGSTVGRGTVAAPHDTTPLRWVRRAQKKKYRAKSGRAKTTILSYNTLPTANNHELVVSRPSTAGGWRLTVGGGG